MIFAWDVDSRLADFSRRYARHALALGAVLRPIGRTVYVMPPYVISEAEGVFLGKVALEALEATLGEEVGLPDAGAAAVACAPEQRSV
jgi:adenosylmethionine-8-amino-7-oxononanoate aminotransferase